MSSLKLHFSIKIYYYDQKEEKLNSVSTVVLNKSRCNWSRKIKLFQSNIGTILYLVEVGKANSCKVESDHGITISTF